MSTRRLPAVTGLLVALPLTLATACGSGSNTATDPASGASTTASSSAPAASTPASSSASSSPSGPACGTVWKAGATLPGGYTGCTDQGSWVKADKLGCSSGQTFVRYDDQWYAVTGGRIHHAAHLNSDHAYRGSIARCRG